MNIGSGKEVIGDSSKEEKKSDDIEEISYKEKHSNALENILKFMRNQDSDFK